MCTTCQPVGILCCAVWLALSVYLNTVVPAVWLEDSQYQGGQTVYSTDTAGHCMQYTKYTRSMSHFWRFILRQNCGKFTFHTFNNRIFLYICIYIHIYINKDCLSHKKTIQRDMCLAKNCPKVYNQNLNGGYTIFLFIFLFFIIITEYLPKLCSPINEFIRLLIIVTLLSKC